MVPRTGKSPEPSQQNVARLRTVCDAAPPRASAATGAPTRALGRRHALAGRSAMQKQRRRPCPRRRRAGRARHTRIQRPRAPCVRSIGPRGSAPALAGRYAAARRNELRALPPASSGPVRDGEPSTPRDNEVSSEAASSAKRSLAVPEQRGMRAIDIGRARATQRSTDIVGEVDRRRPANCPDEAPCHDVEPEQCDTARPAVRQTRNGGSGSSRAAARSAAGSRHKAGQR